MRIRSAVTLSLAVVAIASCGGSSDDGSSTSADGTTGSSANSIPEGVESTGGGAINGAVISLLSPELGLFAIDRATDAVTALKMPGVGFVDRENQPVLVGDAVYTMTRTTIEGQSFSNNIGLGKVDLASGEGSELVQIGTDRETDDSQDLNEYALIGGDETNIWVERSKFAESAGSAYMSFDSESGAAGTEFTASEYDLTNDSGTCSGDFRDPIVASDGRIIGVTAGWPSVVDPANGEVEPLADWCSFDDSLVLSNLITASEFNDFATTEDGAPLPSDSAQQLVDFIETPVSDNTMVEGDGSLWWVFQRNTAYQSGDTSVAVSVGGIAEFDLTTNSVVNVWPFGPESVTFEAGEDGFSGTVSSLSQADLRYLDGELWIMDSRDDAPLRVLDPATGELTLVAVPKDDGVDETSATLISSDPDSIWLDVTQWVVTVGEDDLESRSGVGFIDQVDPATRTFVSSIDQNSIILS
ncbi:MAG: hypothetical protein KUG57_04470 [Ilumatobacteraceae bacterium]|nr:hypothetical protein [Ilumatobacteraceae bacterium]